MKLKVYKDNPYYQLLIYLLIKFGITDLDISKALSEDPISLERLDKEAINEMALVQEFNRKFDPMKYYEVARKLEVETDFPSLLDITTAYVLDNKIQIPVNKLPIDLIKHIDEFKEVKSDLIFSDERINFVDDLTKNKSLSFFKTMFYKNYWQNYLSLLLVNVLSEVVPARWRSLQYEPIALVAMLGNASLMESFLALNKDRSEFWTDENPRLLNIACRYNNMEAFECLLLYPHRLKELSSLEMTQKQEIQERANRGRFNNGKTLLHVVCESKKNLEGVKLLLAVGATVHKMDDAGELPLHTAVKFGAREIVLLLWEDYKKNNNLELAIKARDNSGRALIHFASLMSCFEDIIKNILSFDGELVNTVDNFGFLPLHFACSKGLVTVAEILVANDAIVVAVSNTPRKETPYSVISPDIPKEDRQKLETILEKKNPAAFRQEKFVRRLTSSKVIILTLLFLSAAAGAGGGAFGWWLFTFFKLANLTPIAVVFAVLLSIAGFFGGYKCFRGYEAKGLRSAAQKEAEVDKPEESTPLLHSTYGNVLTAVHHETHDVVVAINGSDKNVLEDEENLETKRDKHGKNFVLIMDEENQKSNLENTFDFK